MPEAVPPLHDRARYNKSLASSLGSKLFFVDKVPLSELGLVVDFGCADGSLLKALRHLVSPKCALVGIDRDVAQCEAARCNFKEASGFYTDWASVEPDLEFTRLAGMKSMLVLSSVLHEVLSQDPDSLESFVRGVADRHFDIIVFRDMALTRTVADSETPPDWHNAVKANWRYRDTVRTFEQRWGKIGSMRNFVHFLLKYPYLDAADSAERELSENYLPATGGEITKAFNDGGYPCLHADTTFTPAFKHRVFEHFGFFPFGVTTHLEAIFLRSF